MTTRPEGDLLPVRVQPRARQRSVLGWQGPALRVRVTAAPDRGEANREVTRLLAEVLKVPPSSIHLIRGATSRDKLFRVAGLSRREFEARVQSSVASTPAESPTGAP